MGLFDRLGLTRGQSIIDAAGAMHLGIRSPWIPEDESLSQILFTDLVGVDVADNLPLSRDTAITIPAVSKVRNLLVSTVGRFPLRAIRAGTDGDTDVTREYPWLYRTNTSVSPYERMSWTIDDCLFYGTSLWATERGTGDKITDARWVPQKEWTIDEGKILVNEKPVDEMEVILFNPPFEGLLNIASRTLRGARDVELAWTSRIRHPINIVEFRVTNDGVTQEEIDAWEKKWQKKHQAGEPSFGVTPPGTELVTHGAENGDASMFLESRNAIRTDVGSFTNVRASMIDGTAGVDSLTYSTTEGEKNSFYEFDLPFWTDPIEAALSQDKCVARGTRVRFDKYAATGTHSRTGTPTED